MSRSVRYILAALCLAGAAFFLLPLAAGILLIVAGQALRLSRLPKDILSHLTDTGRREL